MTKSLSHIDIQIAILSATREQIDALGDVPSIEWLSCVVSSGETYKFYRGDTLVSSVDLADPCFDLNRLLAIVVTGDEKSFQEMQSQWVAALPGIEIAFLHVPEWSVQAVMSASLDRLARGLYAQRRASGRAALELAVYRREFDRLQRNFARLEEYIGRKSLQGVTELFEYPPVTAILADNSGKGRFDDIAGPPGASLRQKLPVDSLGFSGLSVFFSAKPERNRDTLRIRLKAVETQTVFAEWALSSDRVNPGWVELALNHAIDEPALSLELLIDWPSERSGWGVALGAPHPYAAFCARVEGAASLDAPLALRLFANLPGVRVAPDTNALRPVDAPYALSEAIPLSAYSAVAQVVPLFHDGAPALIAYDREIDCVTVHPRMGGLSAARIHVVVPRHAWGISARIHLANVHASPTQFAMMVCPARFEARELGRLGQLKSPSPSFSGWRTISPMETGSVSVVLGTSTEERLSLFLVTRQSPELSPDFAWARFNRFEFHILPSSLLADDPKDSPIPIAANFEPAGEELAVQTTAE